MKRFELSDPLLGKEMLYRELHRKLKFEVCDPRDMESMHHRGALVKRVDKTRYISPKTARSPSNEEVPNGARQEPTHQLREQPLLKYCWAWFIQLRRPD